MSPGGAPAGSLSTSLDSCSLPPPPALRFLDSCSAVLSSRAPSASQGADVQPLQQRLPYQPVNCSADLSKDIQVSALGLGSSSGGPPRPSGACTLLKATASVSFRVLFNSPQPVPTACRSHVSKSLSSPFLVQDTVWLLSPCWVMPDCRSLTLSASDV